MNGPDLSLVPRYVGDTDSLGGVFKKSFVRFVTSSYFILFS